MKKIVLEHEKPSYPPPGEYQWVVSVPSGSVSLQIETADNNWQTMTDGVFAGDADGTVTITENGIRASISGDGDAYLRRVNR